jgi:ElaB/YqjD/DUF883 family membrane-anchored ribosome-binding protein
LERVEADLDLSVNAQRDDVSRSLIKQRRLLLEQWDALANRLSNLDEQISLARDRIAYEETSLAELRLRVAAYAQQAQAERAAQDAEAFVRETPQGAVGRVTLVNPNVDATLDPSVELELMQLKQRAAENASSRPTQAAA